MSKIQELHFEEISPCTRYHEDGTSLEIIVGPEDLAYAAAKITKDIAIKFAQWRIGPMFDPEKGIDGKAIIRKNPEDYSDLLFEEFLKTQ